MDRACRAGHGGACFLQAKLLGFKPGSMGPGVPHDPQKAVELYENNCFELGDSVSCFELATLFLRGDRVRVEASSRCQLRCPACPTGVGKNRKGPVGAGNLQATDFAAFLADLVPRFLRRGNQIRSVHRPPQFGIELALCFYSLRQSWTLKSVNGRIGEVKHEIFFSLAR